jgi:hypothetical protein
MNGDSLGFTARLPSEVVASKRLYRPALPQISRMRSRPGPRSVRKCVPGSTSRAQTSVVERLVSPCGKCSVGEPCLKICSYLVAVERIFGERRKDYGLRALMHSVFHRLPEQPSSAHCIDRRTVESQLAHFAVIGCRNHFGLAVWIFDLFLILWVAENC